MAMLKGSQATNASTNTTPSPRGSADVIAVSGDYTLTGNEASGDIIEMIPWPENTVPVDVTADVEDCGTTATSDLGVMSGVWGAAGTRTMGAEFMTGKAFGTAGVYRSDVVGFSRLAPSTSVRSIGIKMTSVNTPTAGAKIRVTGLFRAMVNGA